MSILSVIRKGFLVVILSFVLISHNAFAQDVRKATVYEALTIEEFYKMVEDMGESPKYIPWKSKKKDNPNRAFTVRFKYSIGVRAGKCEDKLCSRFYLFKQWNEIGNVSLDAVNKNNLYAFEPMALSKDRKILWCNRTLNLEGGVTARFIKKSLRTFHDWCAQSLRNTMKLK